MLGVGGPFATRPFDVGLTLAVELFHRDGRPPSRDERATQHLQPEPVLLRVVMDLAEHDHRVTLQPAFPAIAGRRHRARTAKGCQQKRRNEYRPGWRRRKSHDACGMLCHQISHLVHKPPANSAFSMPSSTIRGSGSPAFRATRFVPVDWAQIRKSSSDATW